MELGFVAESVKMFVGSCYRDQERANIMSEICIVAITSFFNRPGVAGAVLQTALSLINSVTDGL